MNNEEKITYKCSSCGIKTVLNKGEKAPICCEKEMIIEPIPYCTTAPHPEMARNSDEDEPCDDGRSVI